MRPKRRAGLGLIVSMLVALWAPGALAQEAPTFSNEEIEQLVAPIALYPDALVAQVLMASTYPLEIVEAARFAEENPNLKDAALDDALKEKSWDDSVKSLVSFPQVLTMMNEKVDWTQKLGDAFLAQQGDVMGAVQTLRAKAKAEGNLETTEQQKVIVVQAPAPPPEVIVQQAPPSQTIIKIEPANPQVIYVPTYNPTVVYGAWPYPTYPPYYYYPPGYVAGASLFSFGIGMAVGASLWGDCDWGWGHGGGDIDIDINHHNEFNRNVNKNTNIGNKFEGGKWKHDASHRKGVQYRDKATQQRFDRTGPKGADSREAFRGRAEQGREQIKREGTDKVQRDLAKNQGAAKDRAGAGKQRPGAAKDRAAAGQQRPGASKDRAAAAKRPSASPDRGAAQKRASAKPSGMDRGRGSGAFQGSGSGKQVRRDSSRGHSSRSAAGKGGSRGGGGGSRRGGGGRSR